MRLAHRVLYRLLPLEGYLRVVSRLFFLWQRLGIGRHSAALEYVYHLEKLVRRGDHCLDIGTNLGYYTRTLARLVGPEGVVHAVEPMAPTRRVLERNVARYSQRIKIYPYALGEAEREVVMANDSARESGYLGTGQNFVKGAEAQECEVEHSAQMRRGSELFGELPRLDFIKCDIEGYEWHVMQEMRPIVEKYHPTVLIESGGENRPRIIALFEELGYRGYTLERGVEVPLSPTSGKDIIFRNSEFKIQNSKLDSASDGE